MPEDSASSKVVAIGPLLLMLVGIFAFCIRDIQGVFLVVIFLTLWDYGIARIIARMNRCSPRLAVVGAMILLAVVMTGIVFIRQWPDMCQCQAAHGAWNDEELFCESRVDLD